MEIVAKLSDFHVPYQDDRAISVAIKFIKAIQPLVVVIDEVIDFYSLSKFNKDPNRKLSLQQDLDKSNEILQSIRKAVPKARIVMVESNHDKRLVKYLNSKAEELYNLRCLKIEQLLGLKELGIEYKKDFTFRGVLFKHGNVVRQHSGYTAKAEMEREIVNGVSGHTHRLSAIYKTVRGGEFVWMEGGCLCKTKDVEYIDGTPNWQQGLSLTIFKKGSKRFDAKPFAIIDYEILWGHKVFKG